MFYCIYHYFLRHPLGKMILDFPSRELLFKTNLYTANSITKRSVHGVQVRCNVPRSLDHFVGDPS